MVAKLKKITVNIIAGANIATIIVMMLVGYSYLISPQVIPLNAVVGLSFPVFLFINLAFLFFWVIFKLRYAIIPVIGLLICFGPIRIYSPLNVKKAVPDDAIKVLTYNVARCAIDSPGIYNSIPEYLVYQDADLVCLQEFGILSKDNIKKVDSLLLPKYKYKDAMVYNSTYDVVFLYSKYPIIKKEEIHYETESNISAAFYIKYKGDTIIVINNHLESTSISPDDQEGFKKIVEGETDKKTTKKEAKSLISKVIVASKVRAPQAEAVAKYVKDHSDKSIILCGDFNDSPISYVTRTIAQDLTDCYAQTANGPGVSFNKKGFFVRIDNIMCSKDFEPFGCKVDNKIGASDHYPMYCWLKKRAKP